MKAYTDVRLRVLILTVGLVSAIAVAIQLLPDSNKEIEAAQGISEPSKQRQVMRDAEIAERFQQGVMMLHAEKYEYAVAALHRVLELSPKMPEAHVNMGFALHGQGHHAAARDFFYSAIELHPNQANAYWGLAISLEALCDIRGAIGAMRTYVHLENPTSQYLSRARAALWEWEIDPDEKHTKCRQGKKANQSG